MAKKKSIHRYNFEDARFITDDISGFVLESPQIFDEALERISDTIKNWPEEGPTCLEYLLKRIEVDAKQLLSNHGFSPELDKLINLESEHTYWAKNEFGTYGLKCDVPYNVLSAKQVLFSASHLREFIRNNQAEDAAIEMMRLMCAALGVNLHDYIMYGIRLKQGQKKGGPSAKVDKRGYYKAIEEIVRIKGKKFSRENMWRYFMKHHEGENNSLDIDGYEIWYEADRLYQRGDDTKKVPRQITRGVFFNYITEIRPVRKK